MGRDFGTHPLGESDTGREMSLENVGVVRSSLAGWNRGDIDAWLDSMHPDFEFRTSGAYLGIDPVYRGEAGLRRFWRAFREPWESLEIHIDETRETGDEVLALCTFEGHARDGMTVRREVAYLFRFVNNQTTRADSYGSWKEALEVVGLSE